MFVELEMANGNWWSQTQKEKGEENRKNRRKKNRGGFPKMHFGHQWKNGNIYVLVCNRWRLKNVLLTFQDNFLRIEQVLLSGRQKTKTLIYNSHQCIKKIETKIKIPNKHLNIEFTVKFYVQKSLKHKYNNTICE